MLDLAVIQNNIDRVLTKTEFANLGERITGKVRDIYVQDDKVLLISTDRHSSFDRNIAYIPFKGQVLTQTSFFNFKQTEDIVPNHIIAMPDPNVIVAKKCTVAPVEVVVRGFITGVTGTALWTRYANGQREFGDFTLPDGMKKNQQLEKPLITPTTKFEAHDRNVTTAEILDEGLLTAKQWDEIQSVALKLFARGQEIATERGLILVDTKYEFGYDEHGVLTLIDEIHTQDSSRYWYLDSYQDRFNNGEEPEYFDKEFLRLWFRENCDPYHDETLPPAPAEMVAELSRRYIEIYEKLSGSNFEVDLEGSIIERIERNLEQYKI
jgi:phosphoribosylaminoimidazole-succinocarboxamide synthase